ncbi:RNA-guided pseudouridylation complex pseudouridine synthase subunit Cbf5 [Candidatus Woesearchaeota archaeon]|nr:RNA-guided pseudouridylation complex pseudouridine synthase subunit Cbf5 [Candidatus Woesearchaeota archaeon]
MIMQEVKADIIVKQESSTNPSAGIDPNKRGVEELIGFGVININKPKGPTSHQVSDYVQRILGIKKSGHSGTLDPAVTGVLPVALGRATRIVQTLLPAGKEYVCVMHLHKETSESDIKNTCKQFIGKIKQIPPIKSAVKRQERERSIYYLDILEIQEKDVLFVVGCEAGTYIRKLCHQIGEKLGGAHMAELVRTKAGCFSIDESFSLQELADAYHYWKEEKNEAFIRKIIMPIEYAIRHLQKVYVLDSSIESLCHGRNLGIPGIAKMHKGINQGDIVGIMSLKEELVAIGPAQMTSAGILEKSNGIAVITEKVFMKEGTYS